jgi:hypothetical protein
MKTIILIQQLVQQINMTTVRSMLGNLPKPQNQLLQRLRGVKAAVLLPHHLELLRSPPKPQKHNGVQNEQEIPKGERDVGKEGQPSIGLH